jgi:hypothetical protein
MVDFGSVFYMEDKGYLEAESFKTFDVDCGMTNKKLRLAE